MPPKKDAKGPAKGKQGKQMKDFLPANAKLPREGVPLKPPEEFEPERVFAFSPCPVLDEWPGHEAAQEHDYSLKNEEGEDKEFEDPFEYTMPPSFADFERKKIRWLRPYEYLIEFQKDLERQRTKEENKTLFRRKR